MEKRLWYMAHPYSDNPERNFDLANERASRLVKKGFHLYSPISHTHPIHMVAGMPWEFWMDFDESFMKICDGIILCPGWENSKGCNIERKFFQDHGKDVLLYEEII